MPSIPSKYTRTAIALHWAIALLIFVNIVLGFVAESLPDAWLKTVMGTHKSIGISVLGLALMRLLWRFTHQPPPLPAVYPRWERLAAHTAHIALYVLIIALPFSGLLLDSAWKFAPEVKMYWFGLFEWPRIDFIMQLEPGLKKQLHHLFGEIHESLAFVLIGLWVVHVGAALKHQFIDKHPELQRMLP